MERPTQLFPLRVVRAVVASVVLVTVAGGLLAEEEPEPLPARIDRLIQELGDEKYSVRERAQKELAELGYELLDPDSSRRRARAALPLAWYRARMGAWNAAAYVAQRSPLWRRRHPRLI